MYSHLRTKIQRALGVIFVGGLAAAAFGFGLQFQPDSHAGKNLYDPHRTHEWAQAGSKNVVMTALRAPSRHVADNSEIDLGFGDSDDAMQGDSPAATFQQVYLLVKRNFVDPMPEDGKMGHAAVAAMLSSLQDPQSRFVDKEELADLREEIKGVYHGVGAVMAVRKVVHPKGQTRDLPGYTDYQLAVVSPVPGSPAEKTGLKPGDVIREINQHWIASYDPSAELATTIKAAQRDPVKIKKIYTTIQQKVDNSVSLTDAWKWIETGIVPDSPKIKPAAESGKPLTLSVLRAGEAKPLTITVDASTVTTAPSLTSRTLPDGLGYIKITQFVEGTDAEFNKALDGFGTDLKGLVLDLRNSPGGLMDTATAVASRLTTERTLGFLRAKGKRETAIGLKPASALTCPIVVLANGGTAGTSELVVSALQARGMKAVGATTFGDGYDVQIIPLKDGSAFTMTVAEMLKANHQPFAGIGVKPDVVIPDSAGSDQQLMSAIGILTGRVASRAPLNG
jgi:carboxyl-terminal processing protease